MLIGPVRRPSLRDLRPDVEGARILRRKVRRWKPEVVAFVGVTLYRSVFGVKKAITLGPQAEAFEGARVFVLPNPSGRNANYSQAEMLAAFVDLRRSIKDR